MFDDLERAYDTIPREMVMVTLRWMGASEAEVRMVESTYEMTTAKSAKLSDEAVEKLGGGGSTSNTLTKGKIGRERIYYVYGLLCTMY